MCWLFSKVFLLSWVAALYRNLLTDVFAYISHKLACSQAPLPSAKPAPLPKLPSPCQWSVQSVTPLWHIWILSSCSLLQSVARSPEVLLNVLWFCGLSNFCWSSVSGIAIISSLWSPVCLSRLLKMQIWPCPFLLKCVLMAGLHLQDEVEPDLLRLTEPTSPAPASSPGPCLTTPYLASWYESLVFLHLSCSFMTVLCLCCSLFLEFCSSSSSDSLSPVLQNSAKTLCPTGRFLPALSRTS